MTAPILMTIIVLSLMTAACIKFIHYCIGSPVQDDYYSGRIFSDYGRFITDKYKEWEESEYRRVWANYNEWKQKRDDKLNEDLKNLSATEAESVYDEYLQQVDAVFNSVTDNMRANPYSMLGACPICFGTWIALIMWIFFVIFVPLPLWFVLIGAPTSVVLSRYIKITE